MPAQNARPAPVTTTARTASSRRVGEEDLLELARHRQVKALSCVGPVQGQRRDAVVVDRPVEGLVGHGRLVRQWGPDTLSVP